MTIIPRPRRASILTCVCFTLLVISGLIGTVTITTIATRYPGVVELELSRDKEYVKGYVKIDGRSE